MLNIFLIIHAVISILLVTAILLQRSNSDALSNLGSSNNPNAIVNSQSAANFLTKFTVILGGCFIINSLILGNISSKQSSHDSLSKELSVELDTKKELQIPISE
jgi:preprotein translocase subunit SecG